MSTSFMAIQRVVKQGITHPFGDARAVKQAFPAAVPSEESDPFLMCDYFHSEERNGPVQDEDDFPVGWHPHRGMDILSYLRTGVGRHGDSLGNRGTFNTPGMQWMSTGSGVEHAEGGANVKGALVQGFQIWINVPSKRKMDDPRYGTVPTEELPLIDLKDGRAKARVLAGDALDVTGPFRTVPKVQMVDFELQPNAQVNFDVAPDLDTVMLYVYEGQLETLNGDSGPIDEGYIALMDATDSKQRTVQLKTGDNAESGANVLLFAGKKIKEPIAWHGPIVMNTDEELAQTFRELRSGTFPPKRVSWDYKKVASKPKGGDDEAKEL